MSTKFLAGVLLLIVTAALGVLIYQSLNSGGSKLSDLSYVGQTPPDVVIIDETVYTRADNLAWIRDLNLQAYRLLGGVNRTGVTSGFKNFDATAIPVGTAIYAVSERTDIVLVLLGGVNIPYYAEN